MRRIDCGCTSSFYPSLFPSSSSGIGNNHFYVENILEELDSPGEWWFNRSDGSLYLMPNGTLDANSVISLPMLDTLVAINGSFQAPVVVCLEGRATSPGLKAFPYRTSASSIWASRRRGPPFSAPMRCRRAVTGPSSAAPRSTLRMPRVRPFPAAFSIR